MLDRNGINISYDAEKVKNNNNVSPEVKKLTEERQQINEQKGPMDKTEYKSWNKNTTAAWAGQEERVPGSNVAIPSEEEVIEAREWVNWNGLS